MNKSDILQNLSKIKSFLYEKYNVAEIGLFGSFSRDDNDDFSDVDILVDYSKAISLFQVVELIDYLENVLNKKVDLVNKKNIKELMKKQILNEVIYI